MAYTVQLTILFVITTSICITQQKELVSQKESDCDCGAPNRRTRIIGGSPTRVGQYPWMVAIFKKSSISNKQIEGPHMCGAVLISSRWLLSAAHCFTDEKVSNLVADLGDHVFTTRKDADNVLIDIKTIIEHPDYDTTTAVNDVALLELKSPVTYTKNIRPICIPPANLNYFGQQLEVAGWGVKDSYGSLSSVLLGITFPVISIADCEAKYIDVEDTVIDDSVVCTLRGGSNKILSTCQGDSGGPAVMMCDGRYILTGIVSFGGDCKFDPTVYANVSFYRSWIFKTTKNAVCGHDCKLPSPPVKSG